MITKEVQNRVPKIIHTGFLNYDVLWDADKMYEHDYNGETSYRGRNVKLNPQMSDTQVPLTFLHEVLHVMGEAFGINYWERHKYEDDKTVDQIDMMARALLQFMRHNKEILQWLVEPI